MPALESATLTEITADAQATPVSGTELQVQFNPASLRLQLANRVEGGDTRGRQTRQYLGKTSTTLTFDLHFDTADEGTTESPVSVRGKTAMVERFVLPKGTGNDKQAPPKARFHWNELVIDGVIDDLTIDFDLFASNGTPLRAKMSVAMKEQDAKYELLETGPGANTGSNATRPGQSGNGPGSIGILVGTSVAVALGGESAAEFAARVGVDPAAWRGLSGGLDSTLSLPAGASIDFNAGMSVNSGVGVTAGVESGTSASLDASFGLAPSSNVPTSAGLALGSSPEASAGFALAAAGGVGAAIATVAAIKADRAAADAQREFFPTQPAVTGAVSPTPPEQSRTPLAITGMPSLTQQAEASPAPPPPLADTRATTFGFGVPLRPRVTGAAEVRSGALSGHIALRPRERASDVLTATDPKAAPWTQLPADATRTKADAAQRTQNPTRRCGCSGPCRHGSA